jgi:ABC-2 type transport system ATP-binding protein
LRGSEKPPIKEANMARAVRKGPATTGSDRRYFTGPEETVIRVRGLRKDYGGVIAIDAVNLDVHRGEVLGIFGPVGAGKTTTLEIIEGLREPDAGEIEVAGYDALRERDKMKRIIGVMPRKAVFPASLTLEGVLRLFAGRRGVNLSRESVRGLLNIAALAVEADLRLDQISYGQQRRLWFALALVGDPKILLLDDPTEELDWRERREFWRVVHSIRDARMTVIVATRHAEEAGELCDRVALMDRGTVLICDTPHALISSLDEEAVVSVRVEGCEDLVRLEPNLNLLHGALGCDVYGEKIRLRTDDAGATVAGLYTLASERGVSLAVLSVRSPDLEDAFVSYAGRRPERAVEPLGCVSASGASCHGCAAGHKSYTERWSPPSFRNVTLARCLPRVAGVSSSRKLQEG